MLRLHQPFSIAQKVEHYSDHQPANQSVAESWSNGQRGTLPNRRRHSPRRNDFTLGSQHSLTRHGSLHQRKVPPDTDTDRWETSEYSRSGTHSICRGSADSSSSP